jgi:hypothetical protein
MRDAQLRSSRYDIVDGRVVSSDVVRCAHHRTPLIWRLRAPDQGSTVGRLLSVSSSEEHHERRTIFRRGGNPRTCDSGSEIDS